jgi:hypothetical protein
MPFVTYYSVVIRRAWHSAFDGARKIGFFVTIAAGILLLAARELLPEARSAVVRGIMEYAWIVPATYLVLSFGWRVLRAPYEIHLEMLAQIPDFTRAGAKDGLRKLMLEGENILSSMEQYRPNVMSHEMVMWRSEVERSLGEHLGEPYAKRFEAILGGCEFIGEEEFKVPTAMRTALEMLKDVMRQYA